MPPQVNDLLASSFREQQMHDAMFRSLPLDMFGTTGAGGRTTYPPQGPESTEFAMRTEFLSSGSPALLQSGGVGGREMVPAAAAESGKKSKKMSKKERKRQEEEQRRLMLTQSSKKPELKQRSNPFATLGP
jgi:hypothetical protein